MKSKANKSKVFRHQKGNIGYDTMRELAAALTQHYRDLDGKLRIKFEVKAYTISDWLSGRKLPEGAKLPPPKQDGSRQWSLKEWVKWFDRYIYPRWKVGAVGGTEFEELREQNEREKMEYEIFQRQREMGLYVKVEEAAKIGGGCARQLADLWKNRNERQMIEAFEAFALEQGIAERTVQVLKDWLSAEHRKFTDTVETKAEAMAGQFKDELDKLAAQSQ